MTHDQAEALLPPTIVVMNNARLMDVDTAENLWRRPPTSFTARSAACRPHPLHRRTRHRHLGAGDHRAQHRQRRGTATVGRHDRLGTGIQGAAVHSASTRCGSSPAPVRRRARRRTAPHGQVVHNEGVVARPPDWASRRSNRSTTSTMARPSSSAPTASAGRHGARRAARPRGHRRHLHVGHPGAPRADQARRGGLHDRPARHAETRRGRRDARLRAGRHRGRRRGGVGDRDPAQEADGADLPVDPAALEVREARRLHGRSRATS